MRNLFAPSRRWLASSFLAFCTIGNVAAVGCNGPSSEDEGAGGEGGEKPSAGGRKASGGGKASGGSQAGGGSKASGGKAGTGGAAGAGAGAGGRGSGGAASESALEKACRLWAEHQADEAEDTACEVDVEGLAANCVQEAPGAECLEQVLARLE